jgi:hypothetical protein
MKFLTSLLGQTKSDHQRITTIHEKLKVEHIIGEIQSYQQIGYNMLKGWNTYEYPGWHWDYKPKGKRNIGQPKTGWRGKQHLQDSFHRTGPRCPTLVYVHHHDDF